MADHKECLLDILEDLDAREFKKFQWRLHNEGVVKKANLDNADKEQTVDVMVGTYDDDDVLEVTKTILNKIQRIDLVRKLPNTGSDSGSKGPGPAKRKTSSELAEEPAAQKIAQPKEAKPKKAISKKNHSTVKTQKIAQPKEAKPEKAISKKKTAPEGSNKKLQPNTSRAKPPSTLLKKKNFKIKTWGFVPSNPTKKRTAPEGSHKKLQPNTSPAKPPSTLLKKKNIKIKTEGFVTLQGRITSMTIQEKIDEQGPYPLQKLKLDGVEGEVALWREAAQPNAAEGMSVKISHLKRELHPRYGQTFNSTRVTNFEVLPKKKDPNEPKRPTSAYVLFCNEHRPKVREQQPGLSFGDYSKILGEMWSTLTQSDKQPYEKKAQELREKSDTGLSVTDKCYEDLAKADKKAPKKKDPNAPKQAPSAYLLFCNEHRPKVREQQPGLSFGDYVKILGEMWSTLTQSDKQPYEKKAQELKKKKYDTV